MIHRYAIFFAGVLFSVCPVFAGEQTSAPKLRIMVDRTMTVWLKRPMEDAIREYAEAGFSVFSPFLNARGGKNPQQMREVANLAQRHGMSTVVWIGGTRRAQNDNDVRFITQSGEVTHNLSPNSDTLWNWWTENFLRMAEVSRDTVLIGAFLDFETYPFVVWAYSLSYDEKIISEFGQAHELNIPSLEPDERYPWLVQKGHHDAFEKFQVASWRQRARQVREQIDRINPEFQFIIYPGMKSLFISDALFPEWATKRAPVTFAMVETYGRGMEAIIPGELPVPNHEQALRVNRELMLKAIHDIREKGYPAKVVAGIDPVVRGADPEFSAHNAVMASKTIDGYWVFYDVELPAGIREPERVRNMMRARTIKHRHYVEWFARANEAIQAEDYDFWERPRQTQDLFQHPLTQHPLDQDQFEPITAKTEAIQIGVYELDDAIVQRLQPWVDAGIVTLHPIHATWPSYLKPLDMLLLQDFTYDDFTSGIARGHLRQFVREGGKLILIGDSVGLFVRPDFFASIGALRHEPPGGDELDRIAPRTIQLTREGRQRLQITPASDNWDAQGRFFWMFDLGSDGQTLLTADGKQPVAVVGLLDEGHVMLWGGQPMEEEIDILIGVIGQWFALPAGR